MEDDDRERIAALTEAANELVEQIHRLNVDSGQQLVTLARRASSNRRMIYALAASLALDVMLTVALLLVGIRATNAGNRADQVHAQQIGTCQSSNDARAAQVQLWDYILSLPSPRPRTNEQQRQLDQFRAYVNTVFAPRDCSRI
jgi:hypothetical protein